MGLVFAVVTGFALWIILWAIGAKPIDAFIPTIVIILVALTVRLTAKHLSREQ